jgi:hypothetical protein
VRNNNEKGVIMKFKDLVVLLLIIPVFSAFALDAKDYFPFEIGYTWTYEDSSESGKDTSVTTIVDTIRMSGYKTYVSVDFWEGSEDTTYIQTRPDGIWIIAIDSTDTMLVKILPNSFNIGDSWVGFSDDSTWVDTTYTYIEHGSVSFHAISFEDITVPAGSFTDCVKLQIIMEAFYTVLLGIDTVYAVTTKDEDNYWWLAKDVGNVKSWYLDPEDTTEEVEVLLSFGTGGISEGSTNIPRNISIDVTPNPFNSACNIIVPEHATVEIFDLQGRLIWTCLNINSESIVWHPNKSVGSGIYFIRATVDNQTVSKRILYIK